MFIGGYILYMVHSAVSFVKDLKKGSLGPVAAVPHPHNFFRVTPKRDTFAAHLAHQIS